MLDLFFVSYRGDVYIPEKVVSEVTISNKDEAKSIKRYIENKKINIVKVKNATLVRKLMDDFNIDVGEAEVLVLADEKKVGIVATDDRNAIRACKILKLDFVTAISFLIRAVEKGLLPKDEGVIKLQKLQSIGRYSKHILDDAARQIQGGGK